MNDPVRISRRTLLLSLPALVAGLFVFRHRSVWADEVPAGKKALPESDKMAVALGYKHDAKKADAAKYPQLKKPEAKTQRCSNCNFYVKENATWGKCQLLQNGLVNSDGWCASWVKKA